MKTKDSEFLPMEVANDAPDTNSQLESSSKPAPVKRTRKHRRSNKEIRAEYEQFKILLEEARPVLEICHEMQLTISQCTSYLAKVTLEKTKTDQQYGACYGHCLPESFLKALCGDREDLFKFKNVEGGILVSLHKTLTESTTLTRE